MLHLKKTLSKSGLTALSVSVFFHSAVLLLLTPCCGGQSQVVGPLQPVIVMLGEDIILPCRLEPAVDAAAMTFEWARPDLDPRFVHVWHEHQNLHVNQHPSYRGRTSVSVNQLKQGDVSLKLSKVKLSDRGTYRCYFPDLDKDSTVQLVVGTASSPVISLAGVDRDKGGVVLQCECAGWYPEPEVLWLDGEGKLLSAGPTETVRGPDDLYTVSSRVTVEKRHSNSFTCRVQQRDINQTRETHIQVPDNFFKVQSSSPVPVITGLAVSLAVYIMFIVLLLVLLWKRRQKIIKTTRRYRYVIEKGQKKISQTHKTEDQSVPAEEREHLMRTETGQMKDSKGKGGKKSKHIKKQRSQQQEEAEKGVQTLKEELETKKKEVETKLSELQQLREEKQKNENELQTVKEELENKNKEGQNKEEQQRKEVETLKKQLETQQMDLDSNIKQIDEKQVEVQQLQNQIQKVSNLQTLMETLSKNMEPKTNESVPGQHGASSPTRPVIVPGINKFGKYIRLKNTSSQEQQLKNWEIHVQFNKTKPIIYKFDDSLRLKSGETVRMWPPGHHKLYGSSPNNLEWRNLKTWSSTDQLQIKLISSTGEIKHYH